MKHVLGFQLPVMVSVLCLTAMPVQAAPIDLPDIPQCTELIPGSISVDSTPVTLGLRVVLDGVPLVQAASLVNEALSSYMPLNITLNVSYDTADFSTNNGLQMIEALKQKYGGSRPAGTHLVYALTAKNLTDDGVVGDALAGQADCIGGVAYADSAFAVGEADAGFGAKTMAHELGHLFGGHHHYASCGLVLATGGDNLCTLMINDVGLASFPFSDLNGLVVSGHAQLAAASSVANDSTPETSASAQGSNLTSGSLPWLSLLVLLVGGLSRHVRRVTNAGTDEVFEAHESRLVANLIYKNSNLAVSRSMNRLRYTSFLRSNLRWAPR